VISRSRSKAEMRGAVSLPSRVPPRVFASDPAGDDCRKPVEAAVLRGPGGAGCRIVVLRGSAACRSTSRRRPPDRVCVAPAASAIAARSPARALTGELLRGAGFDYRR
jgi:hypothetical protein